MKKLIISTLFLLLTVNSFSQTLQVSRFRFLTSPGTGKVLTSDGSGWASWQTPATSLFRITGTSALVDNRQATGTFGNFSTTIGGETINTGNEGIVIGNRAFNNNALGISIGSDAGNTRDNGISIGGVSSNSGLYGIAIGGIAFNNNDYGIMIGQGGNNNGNYGIAIGQGATNNFTNSIVLGRLGNSTAANQFCVSDQITNLRMNLNGQTNGQVLMTNGTTASWQSLPTQDTSLFKRGVGANSIMDKRSSSSNGDNSFTIGLGAVSSSRNAVAIGQNALANSIGQFALSDSIKHLKMKLSGQTNGQVLMTNGTTASWQTLPTAPTYNLVENYTDSIVAVGGSISGITSVISYYEVGNIVTVFGEIIFTAGSTATAQLTLKLPHAARIAGRHGSGSVTKTANSLFSSDLVNSVAVRVTASSCPSTVRLVRMFFTPVVVGSNYLVFSYRYIKC